MPGDWVPKEVALDWTGFCTGLLAAVSMINC